MKEKLLAALRSGVKTVLIPAENEKDLAEVPDNVKAEMKIIPVSTMDQVLSHALTRQPVAIEWSEADAPPVSCRTTMARKAVLTHSIADHPEQRVITSCAKRRGSTSRAARV